jgi:hypothetical protein
MSGVGPLRPFGILLAFAGAALPAGPLRAESAPAGARDGARARLARHLTAEEQRELSLAEHLGWQLVSVPGDGPVRVHTGTPCARSDLAEARAAGDLRIEVPEALAAETARAFAGALPQVTDDVGARCGYQHRIRVAVREGTRRLDENAKRGLYTFPRLLFFGDSPWFQLSPPRGRWVERNRVHYACVPPSEAVAGFFTEPAVAECYVAQQVAIFATQVHLYGSSAFDDAFTREEVAIGGPPQIKSTPVWQYVTARGRWPWWALLIPSRRLDEDPGVVLAEHGHAAFLGLSGIVLNQDPRLRSNENFVIVSVSPEAAEILRRHGGTERIRGRAADIWEVGRRSNDWWRSARERAALRAELEAMLASPEFSEIVIYVHPYGVMPLRDMIEMKRKQFHAPVHVMFYVHGGEDAFFQRYKETWRQRWTGPFATGARVETSASR